MKLKFKYNKINTRRQLHILRESKHVNTIIWHSYVIARHRHMSNTHMFLIMRAVASEDA